MYNDNVRSDAAIAVLTKNATESDSKGTLACALPWGYGWGWVTLPNGVWSGGELSLYYVQSRKSVNNLVIAISYVCVCVCLYLYITLFPVRIIHTCIYIHTVASSRCIWKKNCSGQGEFRHNISESSICKRSKSKMKNTTQQSLLRMAPHYKNKFFYYFRNKYLY